MEFFNDIIGFDLQKMCGFHSLYYVERKINWINEIYNKYEILKMDGELFQTFTNYEDKAIMQQQELEQSRVSLL
jgi:hypothetical protein